MPKWKEIKRKKKKKPNKLLPSIWSFWYCFTNRSSLLKSLSKFLMASFSCILFYCNRLLFLKSGKNLIWFEFFASLILLTVRKFYFVGHWDSPNSPITSLVLFSTDFEYFCHILLIRLFLQFRIFVNLNIFFFSLPSLFLHLTFDQSKTQKDD